MNITSKICAKFFVTILFASLIFQITGNCIFPTHYLDNEWRVIVKYESGNLALLRDTIASNGSVLYMVCNENDIIEVTCENGQFNPQFPVQGCGEYMRPELKLENDKRLCPYNLYRVGYRIHCMNNNYFFETYKVCFDFEQKRTLFTINQAYPFVKPRPFGMQFDPDEIFTMNIFSSYNKRDIYAQFNKILGNGQTFMSNNAGDERFDRGHLTPVADYMTNTLIATTFKMINVIPQFHTINDGNWKQMEEWARNPVNTPASVCSGAFSYALQLPDANGVLRDMYLKNSIPIPLWTYKIVLNRDGIRTVFLQYNNIHDKNMPPRIPDGICQPTVCPSNIHLPKSNWLGYTFCCDPNHFMTSIMPRFQGYC